MKGWGSAPTSCTNMHRRLVALTQGLLILYQVPLSHFLTEVGKNFSLETGRANKGWCWCLLLFFHGLVLDPPFYSTRLCDLPRQHPFTRSFIIHFLTMYSFLSYPSIWLDQSGGDCQRPGHSLSAGWHCTPSMGHTLNLQCVLIIPFLLETLAGTTRIMRIWVLCNWSSAVLWLTFTLSHADQQWGSRGLQAELLSSVVCLGPQGTPTSPVKTAPWFIVEESEVPAHRLAPQPWWHFNLHDVRSVSILVLFPGSFRSASPPEHAVSLCLCVIGTHRQQPRGGGPARWHPRGKEIPGISKTQHWALHSITFPLFPEKLSA